VVAEFQKNHVDIAVNALDLLIQYVQHDTWRLFQEIQKLSNFKKGTVTKEDIEIQVKPNIENLIFETIDALASKNKQQAITLLKNHLDAGDNPLYLLSMITYQFRNFLIIKDLLERKTPYYLIAKQSGLHPFVVQKSMKLLERFSLSTLKAIYRKIFEVDEDMKTGKMDPEVALEMLVAEL
jgi:DNA polymerase III subunit delta